MNESQVERNYKSLSKKELDIELFKLYSPFRNDLRQISLIDSLCVVWSYFRNISKELDFVFPTNIQSHYRIISPALDVRSIRAITSEWNLAVLAREIIINSPKYGKESLKDWRTFSKLLNKLQRLEEKTERTYIEADNVGNLIKNMSNRQLRYQKWNTLFEMYVEIFSIPLMRNDYIQKIYNMSSDKFFTASFILFISFMQAPILSDKDLPQANAISRENYLVILNKLSLSIEDMKKKLKEESLLNEAFVMNQDILYENPLVNYSEEFYISYICPIPYLFFWRIFGGVYYDIIRSEYSASFSNDLGDSFQQYISNKTEISDIRNRLCIHKEQTYEKQGSEKRTIDLRIEDSTANLFIECKSARPSQKALREITTNEKTKEDFDRFLEFIIQGYKTISEYEQGEYPGQKPTNLQKILLIVTMEDWHFEIFSLYFNVEEKLKSKLKAHSLPIEYLNQYPYFTCSAYEYQYLLEVLKTKNIYDIFINKKNNPAHKNWGLEEYLREVYPTILGKVNPSKVSFFHKIAKNALTKSHNGTER